MKVAVGCTRQQWMHDLPQEAGRMLMLMKANTITLNGYKLMENVRWVVFCSSNAALFLPSAWCLSIPCVAPLSLLLIKRGGSVNLSTLHTNGLQEASPATKSSKKESGRGLNQCQRTTVFVWMCDCGCVWDRVPSGGREKGQGSPVAWE